MGAGDPKVWLVRDLDDSSQLVVALIRLLDQPLVVNNGGDLLLATRGWPNGACGAQPYGFARRQGRCQATPGAATGWARAVTR